MPRRKSGRGLWRKFKLRERTHGASPGHRWWCVEGKQPAQEGNTGGTCQPAARSKGMGRARTLPHYPLIRPPPTSHPCTVLVANPHPRAASLFVHRSAARRHHAGDENVRRPTEPAALHPDLGAASQATRADRQRDEDGRPYLRRMPASRPQRVCGAVLHTEAGSVPRPPAPPRPNRPPRSTR